MDKMINWSLSSRVYFGLVHILKIQKHLFYLKLLLHDTKEFLRLWYIVGTILKPKFKDLSGNSK